MCYTVKAETLIRKIDCTSKHGRRHFATGYKKVIRFYHVVMLFTKRDEGRHDFEVNALLGSKSFQTTSYPISDSISA